MFELELELDSCITARALAMLSQRQEVRKIVKGKEGEPRTQ